MPITKNSHKAEVREAFLNIAQAAGKPLSSSRANRLAAQFKKGNLDGEFAQVLTSPELAQAVQDPMLRSVIDYRDETGEDAVNNIFATDLERMVLHG